MTFAALVARVTGTKSAVGVRQQGSAGDADGAACADRAEYHGEGEQMARAREGSKWRERAP